MNALYVEWNIRVIAQEMTHNVQVAHIRFITSPSCLHISERERERERGDAVEISTAFLYKIKSESVEEGNIDFSLAELSFQNKG